ncbi:nicotinate-nucleotide pyrophosphorylase [Salix suchowensis]|nr:nicotinate-nucleotide pyrophosphorylase [Salix suchowensis]
MIIKPPSRPTYDLKGVIKLALLKMPGIEQHLWFNAGDVTCLAGGDPSRKVEWSRKDGDCVRKGMQFGKASALNIVVAERVTMVDAAHPACILKTQKTAPGLHLVDKWEVLIGGGQNHIMGLSDMIMIKDNHMSIAGGIINAINSIDWYLEQRNLQMEVEYIKLDNMVIPLPNGDVEVALTTSYALFSYSIRGILILLRFETVRSGPCYYAGYTAITFSSERRQNRAPHAPILYLRLTSLKTGEKMASACVFPSTIAR